MPMKCTTGTLTEFNYDLSAVYCNLNEPDKQ